MPQERIRERTFNVPLVDSLLLLRSDRRRRLLLADATPAVAGTIFVTTEALAAAGSGLALGGAGLQVEFGDSDWWQLPHLAWRCIASAPGKRVLVLEYLREDTP